MTDNQHMTNRERMRPHNTIQKRKQLKVKKNNENVMLFATNVMLFAVIIVAITRYLD